MDIKDKLNDARRILEPDNRPYAVRLFFGGMVLVGGVILTAVGLRGASKEETGFIPSEDLPFIEDTEEKPEEEEE